MAELNAAKSKDDAGSNEKQIEESDNVGLPVPTKKASDLYGNMRLASQSLLDMALLLSNVSELVQVLKIGEQQEFYLILTSLLCCSIVLQVLVGVGLLLIATSHESDEASMKPKSEMGIMNRLVMIGVFLITVLNVFISAFSFTETSKIKTDGQYISFSKSRKVDLSSHLGPGIVTLSINTTTT